MSLTPKQKKQYRAQAHHLNPIVLIGQHGLTSAVHEEIARGLADHELIKIRIAEEDRTARKQLAEELCQKHHAELIQTIGRIVVLFKKRKK